MDFLGRLFISFILTIGVVGLVIFIFSIWLMPTSILSKVILGIIVFAGIVAFILYKRSN